MKSISKILFFTAVLAGIFTACKKIDKADPLPVYQAGVSPVLATSATAVNSTLADTSNEVVVFSWSNPKYANDSSSTKYILEIDSAGGNFDSPATTTVNGVTRIPFTGRAFNSLVLASGIQSVQGTKTMDVRLISSYANNNERYMSNTVTITVNTFFDGSVLTSSATTVALSLANASSHAIDFSWSTAFPGYTGAVNYVLQYDSSGKGFAAPLETSLSSASGQTIGFTQGELNSFALNAGIPGGDPGQVEFRIKATNSSGESVYSNVFFVSVDTYFPIRRFYMPGGYQSATGNGTDWTPGDAPELIRDQRSGLMNNMYYIYIYMPAGQEFKFTQGRDWAINYGGTGGNLVANGANLTVPVSGFYRITIDVNTMKYDIKDGRMGFVGGATGAGWTPPNVFPAYALGNAGTNLFVGLTDLAVDGWKLIDNDQWNNGSNTVDETRSYGSTGGSGSSLETNGANFPNVATAGRYRVIWDGRDRDNVKYDMSPATEMRVVGNGIQGVPDWTPGSSPQMTYIGAGKWQLSTTLVAGKDIKFLAGNDWGAFDYEDNSGGSTATGVARSIKWEGGDNFKTPATTGVYMITLDENNQTVTIN